MGSRREKLEIAALVLLAAITAWLASGRWVPVPGDPAPAFVLVTASKRLAVGMLLAAVAVHARLDRRFRLPVAVLRPLWLLSLLLLPYLRLLAPGSLFLQPLSHFTYEARGAVVVVALIWCGLRWLQLVADPSVERELLGRLQAEPRRVRLTWVVFGVAVAASLAASPVSRFQSLIGGDEPKYLRFCEVLIETQGFDLGGLRDFEQVRPADVHWLDFPRALARTIAEEVPQMARDAVSIVRGHAPATFNRASHANGWFINGKNGGLYQIHLPGLSFLLLPAYAIDRLQLSPHDWIEPGFPTDLTVTSLLAAAIFAAWITALYRFLRDATRSPWLAAGVALVTGLTIPVLPFHFQYYPEAAAGLVLLIVVRHLELGPPASAARAAWLGFLTGYLAWLHNRFAPASLFLAVWFVVRHPRDVQALAAFLATYLGVLGLQALYYYRITGSILPTAMWEVIPGNAPVEIHRIPRALAGLVFDRRFGVLPLAPVYALAPAGLWLAARTHPGRVIRLGLLAATIVLLAAGHFDWWGGGSSPARLVAAVAPFAAMGFTEIARVARRDRVIAALAVVLLALSVESAFTFTRNFTRLQPVLRGETGFGYRTALSFPMVALPPAGKDAVWPAAGYWLAVLGGVTALVLIRARRSAGAREDFPRMAALPVALLTIAAIAVVYDGAAAFRMPRVDPTLLPDRDGARSTILDAIVRHPFGWVLSSARGHESPDQLMRTNLVATYTVDGDDGHDTIDPLQGEPAQDVQGNVLRVPATVRRGKRIARVSLDGAVGGPQHLEVEVRLGDAASGNTAEPALEVRVVDNIYNTELARRVIRTGELTPESYRAFALDFDIPQGAGPVVRLTKLGSSELWIDRVRLEHR